MIVQLKIFVAAITFALQIAAGPGISGHHPYIGIS
jgi:hypothetical protein